MNEGVHVVSCRLPSMHGVGVQRHRQSRWNHIMRFVINIRSKSSCWRRMNDRKHSIIAASQARAGSLDDDDEFCLALESEMKMSAINYDQSRN